MATPADGSSNLRCSTGSSTREVHAARNDPAEPAEPAGTGTAVDVTGLAVSALPLAVDDGASVEDEVTDAAAPTPAPWPPAAEQPATRPSSPADSRVIHAPLPRAGGAARSRPSTCEFVVVAMGLGLLAKLLDALRLAAAQHPVTPPKV